MSMHMIDIYMLVLVGCQLLKKMCENQTIHKTWYIEHVLEVKFMKMEKNSQITKYLIYLVQFNIPYIVKFTCYISFCERKLVWFCQFFHTKEAKGTKGPKNEKDKKTNTC